MVKSKYGITQSSLALILSSAAALTQAASTIDRSEMSVTMDMLHRVVMVSSTSLGLDSNPSEGARGARRSQEEPGGGEPGGIRRSQGEPGGARGTRRSQGATCAAPASACGGNDWEGTGTARASANLQKLLKKAYQKTKTCYKVWASDRKGGKPQHSPTTITLLRASKQLFANLVLLFHVCHVHDVLSGF